MDIERTAYADQMNSINALKDVTLGTDDTIEVNEGECIAIAPEYISSLAGKEAESDGAMGLKFKFEENSNDLISITEDGILTGYSEGEDILMLSVYPSDREFAGDNTSQTLTGALGTNVDGYKDMPGGAIFTKEFKVSVKKPGAGPDVADKDGAGYSVVSENSVILTGPVQSAAGAKKYSIPSTVEVNGKQYAVTGIAPEAFKGNTTLEKVVIGKNVTDIGAGAFYGCTALKVVRMGKNVRKWTTAAFWMREAMRS